MTDREKFKVYECDDRNRALTSRLSSEAEVKREEAASPLDGEQDMTSLVERMGRVLVVNDFIGLLRAMNPVLVFELSTGDPTKFGIYVPDPVNGSPFHNMLRFVTGMESGQRYGGIGIGVMPEFSVIENEDIIVPDGDTIKKSKKFLREIRGWRTVLASLIMERLVSEAQVETTFNISGGQESANWKKRINPAISR